uniref:hypothetical protein n=1 Tax=Polynucleobacter sp. TaxID=2029855 RepID=UPI004047F8A3
NPKVTGSNPVPATKIYKASRSIDSEAFFVYLGHRRQNWGIPIKANLLQLIEQRIENPRVGSSILPLATT